MGRLWRPCRISLHGSAHGGGRSMTTLRPAATASATGAALGAVVAFLPSFSSTWLLVALGAALALLPFAVTAIRGSFDIFEPVYLFALVFGILYVLRPVF